MRKTKIKPKKENWVLAYIKKSVECRLEPLTNNLLNTFRLLFLINNYSFTERQIDDLYKNDEFVNKFNVCIRDSLKDYENTCISLSELYQNLKFNLGVVYNWLDEYSERMCKE